MVTAFTIDSGGKITRWREYYDVKEIETQVAAAGLEL
jgi:limonene-1,2-epoxide hydrolase